jgi:hypothetical protein
MLLTCGIKVYQLSVTQIIANHYLLFLVIAIAYFSIYYPIVFNFFIAINADHLFIFLLFIQLCYFIDQCVVVMKVADSCLCYHYFETNLYLNDL